MFVPYEDLDVYKRAFELACVLHKATQKDGIPKFEQYGGLCDQIRRASQSICANMGEGLSKNATLVEERRILGLALGSCEEVRVWLAFGGRFGYWPVNDANVWRDEYQQISRIIITLMKKREGKTV